MPSVYFARSGKCIPEMFYPHVLVLQNPWGQGGNRRRLGVGCTMWGRSFVRIEPAPQVGVRCSKALSILRHRILQRPGGKNPPLGAPLGTPLDQGKEDFSCVGTTRKQEAWRTPRRLPPTKKPPSICGATSAP